MGIEVEGACVKKERGRKWSIAWGFGGLVELPLLFVSGD